MSRGFADPLLLLLSLSLSLRPSSFLFSSSRPLAILSALFAVGDQVGKLYQRLHQRETEARERETEREERQGEWLSAEAA